MDLLMILGLVIAGIVLIVALGTAAGLFIYLDLMSYTATGSETLSPSGTPAGHALVVYDPGVTGSARNAASEIAGELQSKSYTVELAGVRSAVAGNVSGYDVIVIGGPTHWDMWGGAAKSYLQNLNASPAVKVGVFATGIVAPKINDSAYMHNFVTNLPDNSPVKVKSAMKLVTDMNGNAINKTSDPIDKQCSEFVAAVLQ
jgi:menaquinone-dependent protoporphyrinogen IX oxidase